MEEGLAIIGSPDDQLLDLLAATYRVRRQWWGNQVRLNFLINAKSGACAEDCGYCSQSRVSKAEISRYGLLPPEQILAFAQFTLSPDAAAVGHNDVADNGQAEAGTARLARAGFINAIEALEDAVRGARRRCRGQSPEP